MRDISEETRLNINITIYSSICDMFSCVLNSEFRGEKFDWNSDMIIKHACDMVYVKHNRDKDKVRNYQCTVGCYARRIAKEIYETMFRNFISMEFPQMILI